CPAGAPARSRRGVHQLARRGVARRPRTCPRRGPGARTRQGRPARTHDRDLPRDLRPGLSPEPGGRPDGTAPPGPGTGEPGGSVVRIVGVSRAVRVLESTLAVGTSFSGGSNRKSGFQSVCSGRAAWRCAVRSGWGGATRRASAVVDELQRRVDVGLLQQRDHGLQVVPLLPGDPHLLAVDLGLDALGALITDDLGDLLRLLPGEAFAQRGGEPVLLTGLLGFALTGIHRLQGDAAAR